MKLRADAVSTVVRGKLNTPATMPQQVNISRRLYSLGALRDFDKFWIIGFGYIFEDDSRDKTEAQCIAWRRDFHEHPELRNYEFRTAGIVAAFLKI